MLPTEQQIRREPHARWVEGGRLDGFALDDWIGAEQDLTLEMNYEPVAHFVLDEEATRFIGSKGKRKCRYCRAVPPAPFRTDAHALPEFVGNKSLIACDECDACNEFFGKTIEDSLSKMLSPLRTLLLISGKTGVPTQKANGGGFRLEYDTRVPGFTVQDTAAKRVFQEHLGNRSMTADLGTQPYVPVRGAEMPDEDGAGHHVRSRTSRLLKNASSSSVYALARSEFRTRCEFLLRTHAAFSDRSRTRLNAAAPTSNNCCNFHRPTTLLRPSPATVFNQPNASSTFFRHR